MVPSGRIVLLGSADRDALLRPLAAALEDRGHRPLLVEADSFGRRTVTVGAGVRIDGHPVGAILNRWSHGSPLSAGFAPQDLDFAYAEARAILLDVLTHPSLLAINAVDVATWYAPAEWPVWRTRCLAAGVAVAPLTVGAPAPDAGHRSASRWMTWSGVLAACPPDPVRAALAAAVTPTVEVESALWCCGTTVPERGVPAALGSVLLGHGVRLASVLVGAGGEVLAVETNPVVGPDHADAAATILADWIHDALATR